MKIILSISTFNDQYNIITKRLKDSVSIRKNQHLNLKHIYFIFFNTT